MKFPKPFDNPKTFDFKDSVKESVKYCLPSKDLGYDGMVISRSKVECYDFWIIGSKIIEFEMKIVSEKLDEVAKDENVESGVEDSESEEK